MTDPNEQLHNFEVALDDLKAIVAGLPNEEHAERAIRVEEQLHRLITLAMAPVAAMVVLLLVGLFMIAQVRGAADENREGVQCLLAEMGEHRVANHEIHDRFADRFGVPGVTETLLPERDLKELHSRCEQFFPGQTFAER